MENEKALVDRAIENVRLGLAPDAEAAARLQLTFAGERLEEAANKADTAHITEALNAYNQQMGVAVQLVTEVQEADPAVLIEFVDEALMIHEVRLQELLVVSPPTVPLDPNSVDIGVAYPCDGEARILIYPNPCAPPPPDDCASTIQILPDGSLSEPVEGDPCYYPAPMPLPA